MDELDLLKRDWKRQEASLPKISYDDIYKMIHKKSSSIVKWILIIASAGVAIGAITSSGMMEVARKGIFNPGEFYFNEIMFIFMAVMITDILLLDVFNSLGMPTSTTVSIVFELLGAAVAIALIKISNSDTETISSLGKYINSDSYLDIIHDLTEYTGRPPVLPEYLLDGMILGVQGGMDAVMGYLDLAEKNDVKVSGLWCQDWAGYKYTSFDENDLEMLF